ncbi:MAG: DNA gyrase subunit A, partial [Candidatus Saccharimonadales bacterium]|nr:DNA gyrase subunit A [Candidatus Saccharimonadales bacterium]
MADQPEQPELPINNDNSESEVVQNDNAPEEPTVEPEVVFETTDQAKTVLPRTIEREMEESYLQYSMSVIVARALPDARDGLKPVQRRILYVMHEGGLRSSAKFRKSATVVGDVMGSYHPHGDSAIYDTMVRMAQDFSMRYMLVDGQGNFGSMDGDPPAAYRYTEARMAKPAEELLTDIDKETVDFRPNFDDSKQEPSVLPAKLPNLLLNGQVGIAVGMATSIPPHNLSELVGATKELIDNPEATLEDLLKHVKGPDFPTGGVVYGGEGLKAAYGTGKGSVVIRSVAEIEENPGKKKAHRIIVTQIPYMQNKAALVEKIADLVKTKRIQGISDLRDESSRGDVRIVIDLKKDAYPKKILNQLYKLSPLQTSFHFNMLALIDGIQPRVLGLEEILREYLKHRQSVVRRRTEFDLRKAEARAHILEGLSTALDHIDAVIKTIRASQTTEEAQANLMKKFKLTEIQAKAILAMQLRTLAGLERKKIEDEFKELKKLIKELKAILADEKRILAIIKDELEEIDKRFGDARRTKIIKRELGKFSEEELIPNEQVVITLTSENYIKRNLATDYRQQGRGGKGKRGIKTKDEDLIEQLSFANTHDFLLFFTNRGRVFRLKAYEVPQVGMNAKGIAIVNLLQLGPEEYVTSMVRMDKDRDFSKDDEYLFMATKTGTVKKTALSDYQNIRASGIIAIKLADNDELKWIRLTSGEDEIVITTSHGQSIRFPEQNVRPMGRTARGVRGIRLRPGDEVIDMNKVLAKSFIFVISENGYGKRTKIEQFTAHKRGGVGIKSAIVNKKTGNLVGVRTLTNDNSDVLIISQKGQTIRLGLKDISTMGRTTQGVRIMRLNEGDAV